MAMLITEECINCAACEPECPNEAIKEGDDTYVVDAARCTECVGAADTPKCTDVCPAEGAVVKNPAHEEDHDVLMARYQKLHAA